MIIFSLFTENTFINIIICSLGGVVFGIYLLHDTEMVLGKEHHHRYRITIDDYILAALILYLDILNMFLRILRILMIFKKK